MKIAAFLLALPLSVNAWEKLPGYPDNIYAIDGKLIETTGSFKKNIEVSYYPKKKAFGVSFYNYSNKDDQAIIPGGSIHFRGCGAKATGMINGVSIDFSEKDMKSFKKLTCGEEIYVRVYDEFENYATYQFKSIPELRKR